MALTRGRKGPDLCEAHYASIDVGQEPRLPHDCAGGVCGVLQRRLIPQLLQLLARLWIQLLRLVPCFTPLELCHDGVAIASNKAVTEDVRRTVHTCHHGRRDS